MGSSGAISWEPAAEQALKAIITKDSTGPQGLKAKDDLARVKLAQGRLAEAENLAKEVLKANPKDMAATEIRGLIALNKKDGLTAVNSFRLLAQDQPQAPRIWLLLAEANLVNKEPELAKENAKKALQIKPDYMAARKFLYGMYIRNKDYDGAIKTIQGYLRANSKDIPNLVALGNVYVLKGDYTQARATYNKIIAMAPKNPIGYFHQALLDAKTKKTSAALKEADKALEKNPNFLPALQLMVSIYQNQKQPSKALAVVRQTLARSPKNPQLHQMLGELLLIQKQPQAAIAPLEVAITLNPREVPTLRLLALAYRQMPNPKQAIQQLEKKVANPKTSPLLSLVLATVYEQQHDYQKAINLYNSLLARNLFTPLARNNQAYLLAEYEPNSENLDRAHKLIAQTLEDYPENPSFLDTMGWVLCKQGNYVAAKADLEKALENSHNSPAILYHLGWCEAKLGKVAAARENLEKALASKTGFEQREQAQKLLDSLPAKGK